MSSQVPPEFKSQTPSLLRQCASNHRSDQPAAVNQVLLDAANEIEGSEEAFAVLVAQKRELQARLEQTQANLREAYDMLARARRGATPEQ